MRSRGKLIIDLPTEIGTTRANQSQCLVLQFLAVTSRKVHELTHRHLNHDLVKAIKIGQQLKLPHMSCYSSLLPRPIQSKL